jgi:archaellum component FlaG (FlaF/FlaG flagellin family)
MTETPSTPPGWYASPDGSGGQRYWDGQKWTDHTAPPTAPAAPYTQQPSVSGQQKKGKGCLFWGFIVLVVVVVIGLIAAVAGGGSSPSSDSLKSNSADSPQADSSSPDSGSGSNAGSAVGSKKNPAPRGTSVQNKSAKYQVDDVEVTDSLGEFADKPSGKYVVVTVTVKNVKKSTIQISSSDFTLNVSGVSIDASDNAFTLDDAFSFDDLSPGLQRTGKVVFDVTPNDAGRGVLVAQALFSVDEPIYLKLQK